MISFTLNGDPVQTDEDPSTLLLIFIRESLGLTGTKYGCGAAMCGACTVHMDGASTFSCQMTIGDVEGASIRTIEGLSENGDHPLQKAWIEAQVPQCGYCQSGQIMRAAELLEFSPAPTTEEIRDWMDTNLCRCGTYKRIVRAVERASREV